MVARPEPGTPFTGASACFREGFFYPVVNDEHGNELGPDTTNPLVWVANPDVVGGGQLVHASPEDGNHFHTYGLSSVELNPGEED